MPGHPTTPTTASSSTGTESDVTFSVIDEAIHLLDVATAPWSIQLEVGVSGRLDEARLRAAIGEALQRHPMARARKKPSRLRRPLDEWAITPAAQIDPLHVVDCPDDESLGAARAALQGISVPLTESPPLRAVLARRHDDGDLLMLNVNHAAMDGFGALRVLRSIARAYAGDVDPVAPADFRQTRNLPAQLASPRLSVRVRRQLELATRMRDLVAPPARVASAGATDEAGYGFVHTRLSATQTSALTQRGAAKRRPTVNDVLLASLHLAIADWNASHTKPCRRIGVLVPANLRPAEWGKEVVGNFALPARISTTRRQRRTASRALAAVAAQTARKKQVGMGTAMIELLGRTRLLPLWAKRAFVMALPLTGNRLVDTAMLSNIGRLEDLSFGGGLGGGLGGGPDGGHDGGPDGATVDELWFSPPARMPLGLTIGDRKSVV